MSIFQKQRSMCEATTRLSLKVMVNFKISLSFKFMAQDYPERQAAFVTLKFMRTTAQKNFKFLSINNNKKKTCICIPNYKLFELCENVSRASLYTDT